MKNRSRRTAAALLLALAAAGTVQVAGCSPDQVTVAAFGSYYDATAPEYRAYIAADARLDEAGKARRIQAIDSAGRFLGEARK